MTSVRYWAFLMSIISFGFIYGQTSEPRVDDKEPDVVRELNSNDSADQETKKLASKKIDVTGLDESDLDIRRELPPPVILRSNQVSDLQERLETFGSQEKSEGIRRSFGYFRGDISNHEGISALALAGTRYRNGIHLFQFQREGYGNVGTWNKRINLSAFSDTGLSVLSSFRRVFGETDRIRIETKYRTQSEQLQELSRYSQVSRDFFRVDSSFAIRSGAKDQWKWFAGVSNASQTNEIAAAGKETQAMREVRGGTRWTHLWTTRNYLEATLQGRYRETELPNLFGLNRGGTFRLLNRFPLLDTTTNQGAAWKMSLKLGLVSAFAKEQAALWGPFLSLDSRFGIWDSRLQVSRDYRRNQSDEAGWLSRFSNPTYYREYADSWKGLWNNQWKLSPKFSFLFNTNYQHYYVYYGPVQNSDNLLVGQKQSLRLASAETGFRWQAHKYWSFMVRSGYEHNFDPVNFHRRLKSDMTVLFEYAKWSAEASLRWLALPADSTPKVREIITADLGIRRRFHSGWSVYVNAINLADQNYALIPPFLEQGLRIKLGTEVRL